MTIAGENDRAPRPFDAAGQRPRDQPICMISPDCMITAGWGWLLVLRGPLGYLARELLDEIPRLLVELS